MNYCLCPFARVKNLYRLNPFSRGARVKLETLFQRHPFSRITLIGLYPFSKGARKNVQGETIDLSIKQCHAFGPLFQGVSSP